MGGKERAALPSRLPYSKGLSVHCKGSGAQLKTEARVELYQAQWLDPDGEGHKYYRPSNKSSSGFRPL